MAEEKDPKKEIGFQVEQPGTLVNLTEARERSESITSDELTRVRAQIEAVEPGQVEETNSEAKDILITQPIIPAETNGTTDKKPVKKPTKLSNDSGRYFNLVEKRRLRKAA